MLFEGRRRICQCWFRAGPRWTPAGSDADHEFVCCMSPPIFLSPYFLSALYSSCPVKAWKNAPKANYKRKAGFGPLTLFIWESWRLSCWCRRCDEMANKKILVNPSWNGSLFMGQFTRIQRFNRHIYLWILYPAERPYVLFFSITLFLSVFNSTKSASHIAACRQNTDALTLLICWGVQVHPEGDYPLACRLLATSQKVHNS